MSYFERGSGVSRSVSGLPSRSMPTVSSSRGARPVSSSTSSHVLTGLPEIVAMRSPSRIPAFSAGLSWSTTFTTGTSPLYFATSTPMRNASAVRRNARTRFTPGPAKRMRRRWKRVPGCVTDVSAVPVHDVALVGTEADDLHVTAERDERDPVVGLVLLPAEEPLAESEREDLDRELEELRDEEMTPLVEHDEEREHEDQGEDVGRNGHEASGVLRGVARGRLPRAGWFRAGGGA